MKKSYQYIDTNEEILRLSHQAQLGEPQERALLDRLNVRDNFTVVDAGCGPGAVTGLIATKVPHGKVIGYDASAEYLDRARARHSRLSNISFKLGDLGSLEEADNSIDLIYSRFVFSHLVNPSNVLQEFKRVLRPSGTVCIVDVDDGSILFFPESEELQRNIFQAAESQKKAGGDRFIGRRLSVLLEKEGFTNVSLQAQTFISFNQQTTALVEVLLDSREAYLEPSQRAQLSSLKRKLLSEIEKGRATVGYSVFIATGQKPQRT